MQPETSQVPRETADIETASDAYAARFAGPTGSWMLEVQARAVSQLLGSGRRLNLLEVGGGHGQLARPLVEAGHTYTVLGSDPVCSRRIEDLVAAGRCRFMTGDVTALPFPDQSFDAVLCIRLLTHCARWKLLAAELCRTARRTVIVEYPLHAGLHRLAPLFFGMKKKVEGNTRTWTAFRHREVAAAFEELGFCEEMAIRQFFWPLVIHRMLKSRGLSERLEAAARRAGWTARTGSPAISKMVRTGV
jgi:SAM-dependent methyltransferase